MEDADAEHTTRWTLESSAVHRDGGGRGGRRPSAQGGPWAQRPPGHPRQVTFVVWQYGKIYDQIAKQFEDDWGVKVNQVIEPNVEPQVAKLTAMYAAGDTVDVS